MTPAGPAKCLACCVVLASDSARHAASKDRSQYLLSGNSLSKYRVKLLALDTVPCPEPKTSLVSKQRTVGLLT